MQRAFVDHWFAENFNGTRAAELAGYGNGHGNENVWANAASRLLRNAKVKAEIEQRWASRGVVPGEVVARLTDQMRCSIGDFMDEMGMIDVERVREKGHLVKKYKVTKDSLGRLRAEIEVHDQQRAAELIGKTFGQFRDVQEQIGELKVRVIYDADSDD